MYASDDLTQEVDIATLTNDKTYIIKFTKNGDNTQVSGVLLFK